MGKEPSAQAYENPHTKKILMSILAPAKDLTPQADVVQDQIEISIVIPCLNEAETLGAVLRKANRAIALHQLRAEIIVADNGSTDGSPEVATALGARVVEAKVRGYGAALQVGIDQALGRYIIMGDADDSYDFSDIYPFVRQLRQGYDLVMGCRLPRGGGTIMPGAMPWLHRWVGNPVLSWLGRLFYGCAITDFHCGLRGFSRDMFGALDVRSTGMEFASELIIKAALRQARITEIPITLYKDGRDRPPHLRTWRDGWRHLRFLLMYSPRWLFLYPGLLFFWAGFFFLGVLTITPLHVYSVTLDTNTLLMASMTMLMGFNLLTYSLFSKIFAVSTYLLPPDPLTEGLKKRFSLELGLALGGGCCLLGLLLIGSETLTWFHTGFGPLPIPQSQRMVIPGTSMFILGLETIFSSFLMSLFLIPRK